MKRILLLGSILGWTLQVSGQEVTPLLIPLLEDQEFTPIEIKADCIRDTTIHVLYTAGIYFDKKFGENIRVDEAGRVRTHSLYYRDAKAAGKLKPISCYDNEPRSELENCIYETCTQKFLVWLKRQPYSDLPDVKRFYGHTAFAWRYRVRLVPRNTNRAVDCLDSGAVNENPASSVQKDPTLLAPLSSGHKYTPVEIEADCIRDTIKAYYMAAVLFGENARIDEASVVRSQSIYYEDTGEWKSQFENETVSELENRIYEACSRKYREWSKQLSCSDRDDVTRFGGYGIIWGCDVWLVPKKTN